MMKLLETSFTSRILLSAIPFEADASRVVTSCWMPLLFMYFFKSHLINSKAPSDLMNLTHLLVSFSPFVIMSIISAVA